MRALENSEMRSLLASYGLTIARSRFSLLWQVNNAIVRCVLQGCSALRQLYLDGCRHVTDAGFHLQQSPFYVLHGAVSLETISVQGCPQVSLVSARFSVFEQI